MFVGEFRGQMLKFASFSVAEFSIFGAKHVFLFNRFQISVLGGKQL